MATSAVPPSLVDTSRPTWRLVLGLAWPVLLQQFLVLLVGLSDRFLAGNFGLPGADAGAGGRHIASQSAQTTANYLSWLLSSYNVLVTVGSTALVARFVGAGDRPAAERVANQAIVLAAVLGLLATAVGLVTLPGFVRLLGLEGDARDLAVAYLQPILLLLVFFVIEQAGLAALVGAGDTQPGLWILGGVALLNVPLAWVGFHGLGPLPPLGFPGIAWGTAVSHSLGGLAVLALLARGRAGLHLRPQLLRPDVALLRRMLRVGLPAGLDSLSLCAGQLWFLSIVNGLGDTASSAHGIALGWEALGYLSGNAFGIAAMALIGQNLGARQPQHASRAGWTTLGLGCVVMTVMGGLFFLLAPEMFALFCPGEHQAPVIAAGVPVLRLVAFAMPALSCTTVLTPALRGAGDTRWPVFCTWAGFLGVRIPLAYLLTPALGLFGAWLAMFADLLLRGALFLHRFAGGRWQQARV